MIYCVHTENITQTRSQSSEQKLEEKMRGGETYATGRPDNKKPL